MFYLSLFSTFSLISKFFDTSLVFKNDSVVEISYSIIGLVYYENLKRLYRFIEPESKKMAKQESVYLDLRNLRLKSMYKLKVHPV